MPTKKTTTKTKKVAKSDSPIAVPTTSAADLTQKYRHSSDDTGSTEVQIILLSQRIDALTRHLKEHAGDHDSRRGLLLMVGKRRRLLNYLKKVNLVSYQQLIADLGLRK